VKRVWIYWAIAAVVVWWVFIRDDSGTVAVTMGPITKLGSPIPDVRGI